MALFVVLITTDVTSASLSTVGGRDTWISMSRQRPTTVATSAPDREPLPPVVLLGTAPAEPDGDAWDPVANATRQLAGMVGCDPRDLPKYFGLANLLKTWPSGAPPSREELQEAAGAWRFVEGFRYLLVGSEVVRAFGKRVLPLSASPEAWNMASGAPMLHWYQARCGVEIATMQSPSLKNRAFNSEARRLRAGRFLREAKWTGRGRGHDLWSRDRPEAISSGDEIRSSDRTSSARS